MDLLLDTQVLLWWDRDDPRLARSVRDVIADRDNQVFVSAVSSWELALKARLGKVRFRGSAVALIEANGFSPLAIAPEHTEAAERLAWSHRDPFDRVLVSQAQLERLVLVHADPHIRAFEAVTQLWARDPPPPTVAAPPDADDF